MPWPKLSETLTRPKAPGICQACGEIEPPGGPLDPGFKPHQRWRECDDFDRPTPVVVVLCGPCTSKLIEKHPRLYVSLEWLAPYPGTMPLCSDCSLRVGTTCPMTKANGGDGVVLIGPKPSKVHFRRAKGKSGFEDVYPDWPKYCEQKPAPAGEGDAVVAKEKETNPGDERVSPVPA
jgi:hypothetical protein